MAGGQWVLCRCEVRKGLGLAGLLFVFRLVFYWADGKAISPALIHINNAFVDLTC